MNKRMFHGIHYVSVAMMLILFIAASNAAGDVSVKTAVTDATVEVGQQFEVALLLNTGEAASIGGYLKLDYDPAMLECVEIVNHDIFGQGTDKNESCPDSHAIRITSLSSSFAETQTFSDDTAFATVTFEAVQEFSSTAIRFATTASQIFGTRGGDIISSLDDNQTQDLTAFTPLEVVLNFPEPGATLAEDLYTLEWQIQNIVSNASLELTFAISPDNGSKWDLIMTDEDVTADGTYDWDLSTIPNGTDYLLQASIINGDKEFELVSYRFQVDKPTEPSTDPGVPEPGSFVLVLLGLGVSALWYARRSAKRTR